MSEKKDNIKETEARIDDQELQKIYRSTLGREPARDEACPSAEALLKSFAAETGEKEKLKVADHVFRCTSCLEKFEALQVMFREMKKTSAGMDGVQSSVQNWKEIKRKAAEKVLELEKGRRFRQKSGLWERLSATIFPWTPRRLWAPAGAVLILVVGVFLIFLLRDKAEDIVRGRTDNAVRLIEPKGEIAGLPVFRWKPHPDARGYAVKLVDAELSGIWISDRTAATEVSLPQKVYSGLEFHRKYYWKVTVFLADQRLLESDFQEFQLKD